MHANPPAGMNWTDYEVRVKREWTDLLNSQAGCDERTIHRFLENHPCFVPGVYSITGPSGHSPFPEALISEAPLVGIGRRIPDFIWLSKDSGNFSPVFIEIESPCKRWFTEAGVPHHDLTEAMNQLAEWQAWLNRPENVAVFYEHFQVPDYIRRTLNFRPEFVLIYGRRAEFDERPNLTRLRAQFERHGQAVMTFDRLAPARNCSDYICVTKTTERYRALTVPATLQLGPMFADCWSLFDNVADAIGSNRWITDERKAFLVERVAYWREWARDETRHPSIQSTGDWE
jgi:hypothetical protein